MTSKVGLARFWPILILPIPSVALIIGTEVYLRLTGGEPWIDGASTPGRITIILTGIMTVLAVVHAKGARLFALAFAAFNGAACVLVAFLTTMALQNVWL